MNGSGEAEVDSAERMLSEGDASGCLEALSRVGASSRSAHVAVAAMQRLMLQMEASQDERAVRQLCLGVVHVCRALADAPGDAGLRNALIDALAPERSERSGTLALAYQLRNCEFSVVPQPDDAPDPAEAALDTSAFMSFVNEVAIPRSAAAGCLLLVPERFRPEELPHPAWVLLQSGLVLMTHMAWRLVSSDEDEEAFIWAVKTCMDLAATEGGRTHPLEVLSVAMQALADYGAPQRARDMAEQALKLASGRGAEDRFFAWSAYADAFLRGRNIHEAAVAWITAMQIPEVHLRRRQAFNAMMGIARILRELGMFDDAEKQARRAFQVIRGDEEPVGEDAALDHRTGTFIASVAMKRLLTAGLPSAETLDDWIALVEALVRHIDMAIERVDNLMPPAILLGQCVRFLRMAGVEPPAKAESMLAKACEVAGEPSASRLRAFTETPRALDEALPWVWGVGSTRYRDDLGHDLSRLRILAERSLDGIAGMSHAQATSALELLADHTVMPLGGVDGPPASFLMELVEDSNRIAVRTGALAAKGLELLLLGTSETGRAAHVTVATGVHRCGLETPEAFDIKALGGWSARELPFSFGIEKPGTHFPWPDVNSVEREMARFGLGAPPTPGTTTVLVREPRLLRIPANFMMRDGRLAGEQGPVASAPSVSWLDADVAVRPQLLSGRRVALLAAPGDDPMTPLGALQDGLAPLFGIHGIAAWSEEAGRESELVVLTAHGSVWDDSHFFKAIRDERGYAAALPDVADAVSGAAVVLLLVCSAGRLDSDRVAARAVGLPFRLLKGGTRAVVASPWPLKVPVAIEFSRAFLEGWGEGLTVGEATHQANRRLRESRRSPTDYLAMHVFGNPLLSSASRSAWP